MEGDVGQRKGGCSGAEAHRKKLGEPGAGGGSQARAVLGQHPVRGVTPWPADCAGREADSSGKVVAPSPGRGLGRVNPGAERARAFGFCSPRCPRPCLASGRYSVLSGRKWHPAPDVV